MFLNIYFLQLTKLYNMVTDYFKRFLTFEVLDIIMISRYFCSTKWSILKIMAFRSSSKTQFIFINLCCSISEKPEHGYPAFARQSLIVKNSSKESVKTFGQDPSSFVLDDPVLHFPQSILFLRIKHCYDRADQVLKISGVLKILTH